MAWLETIGVVLTSVAGVFLGRHVSHWRNPWWALGFCIPLTLILMIGLPRHFESLVFIPPFSWIMAGRLEFALIGPSVTTLLSTPISRLDTKRKKVLVYIMMGLAVVAFSVLPFLLPALMKGYFSRIETRINEEGVCYQSNMFNCGPAAAVTALKVLKLDAKEGEIAILAHTNPITGTQPDSLAIAVEERYGRDGIKCRYRFFDGLPELQVVRGVTIVILKYSLLVDHYVTVLQITDKHVVVGNPLRGVEKLSHETFERQWRRSGIVVTKVR